jgi:ribosomal protein S18 acetylase RimI-like enzyme
MFSSEEINVALELIDIYLFNKEQKDYLIYIAENNVGELAGYVCFGPTPATDGTYDLYWIAVSPAHQRKGIGKTLLNYVEHYIKKNKGRLIIIETSSRNDYQNTRKFYINNNYQLSAQIKDFYHPGDDRVIFTKYFLFH